MTPRRALLGLAALLVVVIGVNIGIGRLGRAWDLTAEGSASLSEETLRVLREVDRRIDIVAFFPRDAVGRVEASTLLSRYRRANRRVTFRVLDPKLAPGEAQRLGIQEVGSAAVRLVGDRERIEIAQYTIEIDVTSAIARSIRDVDATVCFTTGHGERAHDDAGATGMSEAAAVLARNGYEVRSIDLLATPRVPRRCAAVVVAAAASSLGDEAAAALSDYLAGAGKAFFLADPDAEGDLTPVVREWGIRFRRGILFERDPDAHLPDDPTAPIVTRYAGGSPAVRGLGPTFYPRAMSVQARDTGDPGLSVSEVAMASEGSYLDREDLDRFDPDVDTEGPVAVGVAADRSEVRRPGTERASIRRTRILAWSDVDFVTNSFIADAANARLWIQGIDWLTQPEDLVTAVPAFPKVRELELTEARSRYLLGLTAGVIPGLFLIAGAFVWVIRRAK